jgi:hypothetical protein
MHLSPYWEDATCPVTQEHVKLLWKPKVYYSVDKSSPLVRILNQMDSIDFTPINFSKIHFIIILPPTTCFPSDIIPYGFPAQILYAFLSVPMSATCPAHLSPFDFIIIIMFSKGYKSWSSSWCSFLKPPSISSSSVILRNFSWLSTDYMALHPRREYSSERLLSEPQTLQRISLLPICYAFVLPCGATR